MPILPIQHVTFKEECKRNQELKMSDIQILRDWLRKQPHLPPIDPIYLVHFLHSNYYRIEPTKKTIENFYTSRTHFPEVFCNRDPIGWKELRKAFTVAAVVPLEQKTKENYTMILVKLRDMDPNKFNPNEFTKYSLMTAEIQVAANGTNEGYVVIYDTIGLSLNHIALLNVIHIKKMFYYLQEAAPLRLKAIHFLNTTSAMKILMNIVKPFIKTDLMQLLHFHPDLKTLKEFIPIEALPAEYGGQAGSAEEIAARYIKLLEENRAWFQYDEHFGRVNESLRVNKLSNTEDLFGVDGSFKRIEID